MLDTAPVPTAEDIRARLDEVQARIAAACERAGRPPTDVRVIGITKTFPVETVAAAVEAGLTDFGENRVQELLAKVEGRPGEQQGGSIRWHLVGSLQRNKAKAAVETADEFHALDSHRLAAALERRAETAGRVLPCYVQVNVSGETTKSGIEPEEVEGFLNDVHEFEHLDLVGLMTLAAPAESEEELETVVRPQLRLLAEAARGQDKARARLGKPPLRLSMGMSGDFEIAVEEGATDVRLGTVLFGDRPG